MSEVNMMSTDTSPPGIARFKVLISAYACRPGQGSEPGIGWNLVQQIARYHEVWVLLSENNRSAIEAIDPSQITPGIHWEYQALPESLNFLRSNSIGQRLHYYAWQLKVRAAARLLHQKHQFDLIHHITYGTYWTPSFLVGMGLPFIWGPVGEGESAPKSFYASLHWKAQFFELLRDAARWVSVHFDPFVKATARRVTIGLATTAETEHHLKSLGIKDVRLMLAVGLPDQDIQQLAAIPVRTNSNPFRFVSIGRLLGWKGFHLGLRAFAEFVKTHPNSEYWIVGDGSERRFLESIIRKLKIQDKVRFTGAVSREEVLRLLGECDVLVHPSLHDSGGWVCLEAMASGRPVLCLKLGGPALQVIDQKTGFVIPAKNPDEAIQGLRDAMVRLADYPAMLHTMAEEARKHVQTTYNWDTRGYLFAELYQELRALVEKEQQAKK